MGQDIKAVTKQVEILPMVKHYINELKLYEIALLSTIQPIFYM